MTKKYRDKLFRGSKVISLVEQLELLAEQSKKRAERYQKDNHLKDFVSAELHEGIYQGYLDSIELIKREFSYPEDEE